MTDDTEANNPYFLHSIPMRDRVSSSGSEMRSKDSEEDDLAPTLNSEHVSERSGTSATTKVVPLANHETSSQSPMRYARSLRAAEVE